MFSIMPFIFFDLLDFIHFLGLPNSLLAGAGIAE